MPSFRQPAVATQTLFPVVTDRTPIFTATANSQTAIANIVNAARQHLNDVLTHCAGSVTCLQTMAQAYLTSVVNQLKGAINATTGPLEDQVQKNLAWVMTYAQELGIPDMSALPMSGSYAASSTVGNSAATVSGDGPGVLPAKAAIPLTSTAPVCPTNPYTFHGSPYPAPANTFCNQIDPLQPLPTFGVGAYPQCWDTVNGGWLGAAGLGQGQAANTIFWYWPAMDQYNAPYKGAAIAQWHGTYTEPWVAHPPPGVPEAHPWPAGCPFFAYPAMGTGCGPTSTAPTGTGTTCPPPTTVTACCAPPPPCPAPVINVNVPPCPTVGQVPPQPTTGQVPPTGETVTVWALDDQWLDDVSSQEYRQELQDWWGSIWDNITGADSIQDITNTIASAVGNGD